MCLWNKAENKDGFEDAHNHFELVVRVKVPEVSGPSNLIVFQPF